MPNIITYVGSQCSQCHCALIHYVCFIIAQLIANCIPIIDIHIHTMMAFSAIADILKHMYTYPSALTLIHNNVITFCSSSAIDSCHSDCIRQDTIWQCQSVERGTASCSHCVTGWHCWFILNLIADGSIRVEWGEPVQFNSTPSWFTKHGQHTRCRRDCGT